MDRDDMKAEIFQFMKEAEPAAESGQSDALNINVLVFQMSENLGRIELRLEELARNMK